MTGSRPDEGSQDICRVTKADVQSYSRKPSLDNAYARVARTNDHLTRLKLEIKLVASPVSSWWMDQGYIWTPDISTSKEIIDVPPMVGVLIGETIYNLRAALDYLIYELAFLDSTHIQNKTQFPIEDSEDGWLGHIPTYLKGVSVGHQAVIKQLQPYYGCDWTGRLRDLSNPDKHKSLTVLRLDLFIGDAKAAATRTPMEMQTNITLGVAFDDGSPVIETLQELKSQVTEVLNVFHLSF